MGGYGSAYGPEETKRESYPKNCDTCLNPKKHGRADGIWRIPAHVDMEGKQQDAIWIECPNRWKCDKIMDFRRRFIQANKEKSHMPKKLLEKSLANFEINEKWQDQAARMLKHWINTESKDWLAYLGQVGSGKTHLASSAGNARLDQGYRVFYTRWADIMQEIKGFEYRLYNWCKDCPILFIDDLYKGNPTEIEMKYTAELIDYRYTRNLVTIITSERTPNNLSELDQATFSRIIEMCDKHWFSIPEKTGWNYRLRSLFKK